MIRPAAGRASRGSTASARTPPEGGVRASVVPSFHPAIAAHRAVESAPPRPTFGIPPDRVRFIERKNDGIRGPIACEQRVSFGRLLASTTVVRSNPTPERMPARDEAVP